MHQSEGVVSLPIGAATRILLWGVLFLTAPVTIAMSVIAANSKSGATVHILATRSAD
jgi:hypothetical protein